MDKLNTKLGNIIKGMENNEIEVREPLEKQNSNITSSFK
jgi:hypothetical protein